MTTLILLPGLDGTGLLFADFLASFGPELEVISVAYPVDKPLGYSDLEVFVRSQLPTDRPYFLLAESFSGPIGISIAASRPAGLSGLILCCSFARNPLPLLAGFRPLLAIAPVAAMPVSLLSFFLLGRFATAALRSALAQSLSRVAPAVLRARARAALTVDVSSMLPHISVPVLYLQATEDRVIPASSFDHIATLAPATQLLQFSAPHFLPQTFPAQMAAAVEAFMDKDDV